MLIRSGETIKMDTGSLYSFEEYKGILNNMGINRNWEVELSYKMYLEYLSEDPEQIKIAVLTGYYNTMYFQEGSLN